MPRPASDAKKRIVQAALKLFSTRGYHGTGIADILKESGVKRGSLYHYFSSKKELGFAAIDEQVRLIIERGSPRHLTTDAHPIDRMLEVIDELPTIVKLDSGETVTPSLAVRLAAVDADFQQRLSGVYEELIDELEVTLQRGVAQGDIADRVNPRVLAHMFTIMCEGMQFTSLLRQREAILEDARAWLKEHLNSLRA
jgi:TetR/AcrR family transcriptional repressor of nem operon